MSNMDIENIFGKFLIEFRNENGIRIYDEKIHEMMVKEEKSIEIDFADLLTHNKILADLVTNKTMGTLDIFSEIATDRLRTIDPDYAEEIGNVSVRIKRFERNAIRLRKVRSRHLNKLISVKGIVNRVTPIKPQLFKALYSCRRCNELIVILQEGGTQKKPITCSNASCPNPKGPFDFLKDESIYRDWQKIRIQEMPEELPPGQLPRVLDCILLSDLVDKVRPGDRITVIGMLKTLQDIGRQGKLTTFNPYLDVNNIEKSEEDIDEIEVSDEDHEKIIEMSKRKDVFDLLSRHVAPNIKGYHWVKKGILLTLLSGVRKVFDNHYIRGDIHVLIIGDPGIAKSQLLKYITGVVPRGLYTSGKGSSQAGLTAAVVKEKESGETILEAGALVIGDEGVVCIDEFEKMNDNDRSSIHETMEQQTVSIHKAGVKANLNARTTVIAAANPTYGRYDDLKTITENIKKISSVILTRFDLIFILKDIPEEKKDKEIARHILDMHRTKKLDVEFDSDFLRMYIYVAKKVKPEISEEADKIIMEFYLKTRNASGFIEKSDTPVSITARYLEGIIRLAEARARLELRDTVTKEDAEEAIEVLKYSLSQVGIDKDTGQPDIDAIELGKPRSQVNKMQAIVGLIKSMEKEKGEDPKELDVIKEAMEILSISEDEVKKYLKELYRETSIYNPSHGKVRSID